jgi:hypothetical protein
MTRAADAQTHTAGHAAATPPARTSRPAVKEIALNNVRFHPSAQMRVGGLNEATVEEYKEAMLAGAEFPAGRAFFDGSVYWGSRGFHRHAAARRAGLASFPFEIRPGGLRDAVLDATGANVRHGLRRTDADKRRAVETLLRDEEWGRWSDAELARQAGVGKTLVRKMRGRLGPRERGAPVLARRGRQVYEMRPAAAQGTDYISNWIHYLVRFTVPQFVRWQRIVAGRTDRAVLSEAVDVVMREAAQQQQHPAAVAG